MSVSTHKKSRVLEALENTLENIQVTIQQKLLALCAAKTAQSTSNKHIPEYEHNNNNELSILHARIAALDLQTSQQLELLRRLNKQKRELVRQSFQKQQNICGRFQQITDWIGEHMGIRGDEIRDQASPPNRNEMTHEWIDVYERKFWMAQIKIYDPNAAYDTLTNQTIDDLKTMHYQLQEKQALVEIIQALDTSLRPTISDSFEALKRTVKDYFMKSRPVVYKKTVAIHR